MCRITEVDQRFIYLVLGSGRIPSYRLPHGWIRRAGLAGGPTPGPLDPCPDLRQGSPPHAETHSGPQLY